MQALDHTERVQIALLHRAGEVVLKKYRGGIPFEIRSVKDIRIETHVNELDDAIDALFLMYGSGRSAQVQEPEHGWFAGTALFGMLCLAALALLIMGLVGSFWKGRLLYVALIVLLVATLGMQSALSTIRALGYQRLGFRPDVLHIEEIAVQLIQRLSDVLFMLVIGLFVWLLADAAIETLAENESRFPRIVFGGAIAVVAGGATVYSVVMAVLTTQIMRAHTFDASEIVLAAAALLFSMALAVLFLVVWRHVAKLNQHNALVLQRSALIMLVVSTAFSLLFAGRLVLILFWFFGDGRVLEYPQGYLQQPVWIYTAGVYILLAGVVGLYIGLPIINALKEAKQAGSAASQGYSELSEMSSSESQTVPLQYDF